MPKSFDVDSSIPTRPHAVWELGYIAIAYIATTQPFFLPGDQKSVVVLALLAMLGLTLVGSKHIVSRLPLPLILFVSWCAISVSWSVDTSASMSSLVNLILVATIAASCGVLGIELLLKGVGLGSAIIVLLSYLVAVVQPTQGLVQLTYNFGSLQGIYPHRNTLAAVLVFGAVSLLSLRSKSLVKFAVLFAITVAILHTGSSAGIAALVVAYATAGFLMFYGSVTPTGKTFISILIISVIGWTALNYQKLLEWALTALGRDSTLTGRSFIWEATGYWIREQPWIGHGWGGTWSATSPIGQDIRLSFGFANASSAHNGYLDVLLQVGIIGLILLTTILVATLLNTAFNQPRTLHAATLFVTVFLFYNLVESRFTATNGLFLVVAYFATSLTQGSALKADPYK